MRRIAFSALLFLMILTVGGCSNPEGQTADPNISPDATAATRTPEPPVTSPPAQGTPEEDGEPEATAGPADIAWREIYREFLDSNYDLLYEATLGGLAGVGFVDLDLDGVAELLLFDSGASAAMGLQIFDIVDGEVQCVSANMLDVGEAYGGEHLSQLYVNANYFESFRLAEVNATGHQFFYVESGNGAIDFRYYELISFGNREGVTSLTSLLYKREEFDLEDGEVTSGVYQREGQEISQADFESWQAEFFDGVTDLGYEAAGALVWENASFDTTQEGFMTMVDHALKLYTPID